MACTRKGHSARHHTIQPARTQRPAVLGGIPAARCIWTCVPLPPTLHRCRIPSEDTVHHILAYIVPLGVRPARPGVFETSGLPA